MPRRARKRSATSIYHIVIQGIDRQIMFNEARDYEKFLAILECCKEECGYELYAYCLMSNHIHLIIKQNEIPLDIIFKKINTSYVVWFNMKYQRTGHLLQDRFFSEPIEDQNYLLTAIRYVHNNPTKAGIEAFPGDSYPWSSIHEYVSQKSRLINIEFIYRILPPDDFLKYSMVMGDEKLLDVENRKKRLPDDVAKCIILETTACSNVIEFQKLDYKSRCFFIKDIHKKGVSIRQLNRLTGTPIGFIKRILSDK